MTAKRIIEIGAKGPLKTYFFNEAFSEESEASIPPLFSILRGFAFFNFPEKNSCKCLKLYFFHEKSFHPPFEILELKLQCQALAAVFSEKVKKANPP